MKKFFLLCLIAFVSSCSNYLTEEEEDGINPNESPETQPIIPMTLKVRSSSQETISFPIQIYLFNHSGKMVKQCEITASTSNLDIKLPADNYELTAFAGLSSNQYPNQENLSLSSLIETEKCKPCPKPIQHGHCSFKLEKKMELSIHLSYIVTSLEFAFKGIPTDATSVEVGVSPTSYAYSLGGTYSNDNYMSRISCQQINEEWVAGPVYVLPSNNGSTMLTLSIERPSGEESLSYTYSSQLEPAQPYKFSGKYNEGISLGGKFEVDGWKPGIEVDFDFSENGQEEIPNQPDGDEQEVPSSTIYCDVLPQSGEFWNDFYVWKSEKISEREVSALLISKKQWFNLLAVNGPDYLNNYKDMQLSNWRVFTKEEAKEFNLQFTNKLPGLNAELRKHNQDELYFYKNERYLCDECRSAFNLNGNCAVRAVGQKQTYYMRALKDVKFQLRP